MIQLFGAFVAFFGIVASMSDEEFTRTLRQVEMQQYQIEEFIRSQGDSGVKQIRHRHNGNRNYFGETFDGNLLASMHNHIDWERHVGSGEFEAVLNGVSFKTRHNDFQLLMPSTTKPGFLEVEEIKFPPAPPEVTKLKTVAKQTTEMREWFKAWRDNDISVRDFRPYFRPVLCYLEGMWTTQTGELKEMFKSDRHFTDSKTWREMHDNSLYMAATGTKSRRENFMSLPTKIYDITNNSSKLSQWLYRIVCHPLKDHLPLDLFTPIDHLSNRVAWGRDPDNLRQYASTRFRLSIDGKANDDPKFSRTQTIDNLMSEIPGLNNYKQKPEVDNSYSITAMKFKPGNKKGTEVLDTSYYHRLSSDIKFDAMANYFRTRGFADEQLFMAQTSQEEVIPTKTTHCPVLSSGRGACKTHTQRWSYAIPLEIIYLTPLSTWNPYDIIHRGWVRTPEGRKVKVGGRNGKKRKRAYNGVNSATFAITPSYFFTGGEIHSDHADTPKRVTTWVMSKAKSTHRVRYSGIRILLPNIPGVGVMRQRYPIMPVYEEGNPIMKELEALKTLVLK